MKEHPILFTGEMVRVVQEGRKTQTRRVIRLPPGFHPPCKDDSGADLMTMFKCPYGVPGDRLWMRENFVIYRSEKIKESGHVTFPDGDQVAKNGKFWKCREKLRPKENWYKEKVYKLHPSIHMPRWASRITLEVTNVRVERVQDISEEDAKAEGVQRNNFLSTNPFESGIHNVRLSAEKTSYKIEFRNLWNSINEKRGYGWDKNPWVWVIDFKEIKT